MLARRAAHDKCVVQQGNGTDRQLWMLSAPDLTHDGLNSKLYHGGENSSVADSEAAYPF